MSGAQLSLLDSPTPESSKPAGERLKDRGIARVSENHSELLQRLRAEAVRVATVHGSVHVDDVRKYALAWKLEVPSALWGAVFAERSRWRIVGYRASDWPQNHAHVSPVRVLA